MAKVKKSYQQKGETQPSSSIESTQINGSSPIASRVRSKRVDTHKKSDKENDMNFKQMDKKNRFAREVPKEKDSTKLYSAKNDGIQKKKFKIKQCVVRINIMTREQITKAIEHGLAKIDEIEPYNLRLRRVKSEKPNKCKPKCAAKVATALITPSDLTAASLWKFLKTDVPEIAPKLLCLAKMNTFSPWPAMVLKVLGKRSEVYFFGDGKTGVVNTSEIVPFERCSVLVKKYLHLRGYSRSVRELELSLNIPYHSSLTNNGR